MDRRSTWRYYHCTMREGRIMRSLRKLGVPLAFCLQTLALLLAGSVTSYK